MEQIFRRKTVRGRILRNPIGSILQQYIGYLTERGHRGSGLHQYVFAAEHFGNWLGAGSISHESVDRFMARHIPTCRCVEPATRTSNSVRAALNRLLEMHGLSRPDPAVPAVAGRLLPSTGPICSS